MPVVAVVVVHVLTVRTEDEGVSVVAMAIEHSRTPVVAVRTHTAARSNIAVPSGRKEYPVAVRAGQHISKLSIFHFPLPSALTH